MILITLLKKHEKYNTMQKILIKLLQSNHDISKNNHKYFVYRIRTGSNNYRNISFN